MREETHKRTPSLWFHFYGLLEQGKSSKVKEITTWVVSGGRCWLERGRREVSEVMGKFCILISVVLTWVQLRCQTPLTLPLKSMQFISWKLYINNNNSNIKHWTLPSDYEKKRYTESIFLKWQKIKVDKRLLPEEPQKIRRKGLIRSVGLNVWGTWT